MTTPFSRRRRRGSLVATVFVALGFAVTVPMLTYAAFDGQRVRSHAVEIDSTQVRELVDYDYGWDDLRGFTRDLPDGMTVSDVRVESATAPTDVAVLGGRRITVGVSEPVTGRHRYLLSYRLAGGPVDAAASRKPGRFRSTPPAVWRARWTWPAAATTRRGSARPPCSSTSARPAT